MRWETLVDSSKRASRRRNVFDIVADLGFLDRKPPRAEPPPAEPPVVHAPAAAPASPLTLVKPHPTTRAETLTDAQQRAAEQRMAAERLLQDALELERRLADEAAQARAADEQALGQELAVALEDARAAEHDAAEHAGICAKNLERIATQKAQAAALQADDRNTRRIAAEDLAATEARVAEARRRLEIADAACSESDRRFNDAHAAEEAARADTETASHVLAGRRTAREEMAQQLHGIRERASAFPANAPDAQRRAAS
ncbi:MAG TPA: hypothetical protein VGC72_07135 [Candidatus Elarobacter sp.]|jgi:hypothetical protein